MREKNLYYKLTKFKGRQETKKREAIELQDKTVRKYCFFSQ